MKRIKTLFSAVILWIGILLIVLMCLFPPWIWYDRIVGYAFLFSDRTVGNEIYRSAHIYFVRLLIQCAIVGLITGGLVYTLKDKKAEGGGK